jgi:hypothetical protein
MILSDVLKEAILLSSDRTVDPASAVVYGPFSPLKVYIHLYQENPILLDVYTPLPGFGNLSPLQVARAAYEKHVSQHIWPLSVITSTVGDVRKFGLYYTTLPADTVNDLFEHVPAKIIRVDPAKPKPPVIPNASDSSMDSIQMKILMAGLVGVALVVSGLVAMILMRSKHHGKTKQQKRT